jgi:hypothetical protein
MDNPLAMRTVVADLPGRPSGVTPKVAQPSAELTDNAQQADRRKEWLSGTLAVATLMVLMSVWTWAIVQMVFTWAEPLHEMRDQLLAHSSML